jgi:hypothetical protein
VGGSGIKVPGPRTISGVIGVIGVIGRWQIASWRVCWTPGERFGVARFQRLGAAVFPNNGVGAARTFARAQLRARRIAIGDPSVPLEQPVLGWWVVRPRLGTRLTGIRRFFESPLAGWTEEFPFFVGPQSVVVDT